jgi:hypothetical protein
MGWTSYHATHYKNGKVDRKAECDAYFMESLNRGYYEVVKSTMVGSVYYAAVKAVKQYGPADESGNRPIVSIPPEDQRTFAAVFLTSTNSKDYYNFAYKDMTETMGPCETDCPDSILKLLSPTDHEYALAWRERCKKKNQAKKTLAALPVGAKIECTIRDETKTLVKHPPAYQFKTPFWTDGKYYYRKNLILTDFKVITE